ncbi:DUF5131 family protein [Micromonospora costi]|uniref:DUF5131 family protein n=2 Tax=Micromonospora costi TaxID=1530042 RepID=A0A3B0A7Q6_9ACTN|nr:DUF5131 family protein [Micromonospora costi]
MKRENHKGCPTARLHGRVDTQVAFLSRIAPALTRKCEGFYGRRLFGQSVEVNGIRRGPVRELVDIQTSTRTFIAEGVATHNCYASATDKRWGGEHWGRKARRRMMSEKYWQTPRRWNREALATGKPLFIFAASMADVFEDHPDVVDARRRLWNLIEQTPALVWMLLTKRPENVAAMVPWGRSWPSNVWLGVSAENQRFAEQRIPILSELPAAVRFVSAAPLLGPVDLTCSACRGRGGWTGHTNLRGEQDADCGLCEGRGVWPVQWVITEGESGPKARPSHPDWFRSLRDQCQAAGVAFHHKQNGEFTPYGPKVRDDSYPGGWAPDWDREPDAWVNRETGKSVRTEAEVPVTGAWQAVWKVGLKQAGRLLDGELHDARPEPVGVLS